MAQLKSVNVVNLRKQWYGKAFILEYLYYTRRFQGFNVFTNYYRTPKLGIYYELYAYNPSQLI